MKFHPYAEVFPLLEGTAFEELVLDIKAHGLREKIWTYEGKILDGRNRFNACHRAKVKPAFREYKGKDALAFVVSLNVQRRHLSETQRASTAAKISTLRQGQQTGKFAGMTQAQAAEVLNVSERSVRSAKKVQERGSKALNDAMDRGEVSVSKAASVVELPKPEQLAAAKQPIAPKTDDGEPDRPDDMEDLDRQAAESFERERQSSIDKWLNADDKLAAAQKEIERQAAEIVALKASRDGEMGKASNAIKLVKQRDRTIAKLENDLKKANQELDALRERISIMEAA